MEAEARRNIEEAIRLYLAPSELDLPESAKLVEVTVLPIGTMLAIIRRQRS